MEIKKKQIEAFLNCGCKKFEYKSDIKKIKYPFKCSKCGIINRKTINYCPYCKSKRYKKWGNPVRNFYAVECATCYAVYLKNPLSNEAQSLYYKNYAKNVHQKRDIKVKQRSEMYKQEVDFLIKNVKNFRKINDILDVGCGGGFLLDVFKKLKKNTFGIEVGLDSYEIAKKKHKMYYGNFDKKLSINRKFDIIIMRGVIEHVDDPKSYVYLSQKMLKKNGYILISATPDLNAISAKIFKERWTQHRPESHLIHLSEDHVDKLFSKKYFTKVGSKSFYIGSPYENFADDINVISSELKKQKSNSKSNLISPAFFGNMMTLIYKKN